MSRLRSEGGWGPPSPWYRRGPLTGVTERRTVRYGDYTASMDWQVSHGDIHGDNACGHEAWLWSREAQTYVSPRDPRYTEAMRLQKLHAEGMGGYPYLVDLRGTPAEFGLPIAEPQ